MNEAFRAILLLAVVLLTFGCRTQPRFEGTSAVHNVGLRSTVIESSGIARITIRNNNPYPVRNLQLVIKCFPANRLSVQPVHKFTWFVPDLILPGNDYTVSAIDANNATILAAHSRGTPDEWIPTIEVVSAEAVNK